MSLCSPLLSNIACRFRSGFTLVELLFVIGVVAVLASILVGVTGKVRERSYAAVCVSNLRQSGASLGLFANDNQGYFPAALEKDGTSWAVALGDGGYLPKVSEGIVSATVCPGSDSNGRYTDFRRVYGLWNGNAQYGVFQFSRDVSCFRLSRELLETDRIIMADSGRSIYSKGWDPSYFILSGNGRRESNAANKVINMAHGGKANALFAGGHVEAVDGEFLERDGRYNWTVHNQ